MPVQWNGWCPLEFGGHRAYVPGDGFDKFFCVACGSARVDEGWACSDCGNRPPVVDGFTWFAADLAVENEGFREEFFTELAAPGRYMVGAVPPGANLASQYPSRVVAPGYMWMSGTSFAAPVVSGGPPQAT